jgi:hypothetical protein
MRLSKLFDGELVYEESELTAVAPYGDDRWFAYTPVRGRVWGDRVNASVRCHNLFEQLQAKPELYQPTYRGALETVDGSTVLFAAEGRNRFVDEVHGVIVMSMTFRTSDHRYLWLNETVAVVEALCVAATGSTANERWSLRAFQCVNELPICDDPLGSAEQPAPD